MSRKPLFVAGTAALLFILSEPAFAGPGCKDKTGQPGDFRYQTIVSGGLVREYNLYVHPRYKPSRPTPLVFLLHGSGGTPDAQMGYSNMAAFADAFKFIVVAPRGIGGSWDVSSGSADVTFVADLIDAVSADYCIHPSRIFATGISRGGGMSQRLACDLSDHIAAIGPVSAGNPWIIFGDICQPERPVPIIQFNGTADVLIPWGGDWRPPVPEMFGAWADLYGCSDETEVVSQKGEVSCIEYQDCEDNVALRHCIVEGGGHNWPGAVDLYELDPILYWWAAPHTTQDMDASREIWKFFAEHVMDDDDHDDD